MGFDSPVHWLIVILIIALLFGGSRVGNLMGELGKGLRSFKQNLADPNETAKPMPGTTRIAEDVPPPVMPKTAPSAEPVSEPVRMPETGRR
jgi:sec-independent protein translocase protein TatA